MGVTPFSEGAADKETGSRSRFRVRSWAIGVAALAAFVLILAACGGGSKTTATASPSRSTTTAPANGNRAAQRQAFTQCMQSHGVKTTNLPRRALGGGGQNSSQNSNGGTSSTGPTTSFTLPPGVTQQQMQSALQACRSLMPAGGRNFQNNPAFAAYRNCLQLHGVTTGTGGGQGVDRTNPTVQAAMQACAALRPAPSSSTSTPPST
jgi:hypothetical protein